MSRRTASINEFYDTVADKDKTRCCVRFCRKQRNGKSSLCAGHKTAKWRAENPRKFAFNNLRDSARRRNIVFTITIEEFRAFCESTDYVAQRGTQAHCLQVDRIDAAKGYTIDNVQVLTTSENAAKGNRERWKEDYRAALLIRKGYEPEIDDMPVWSDPVATCSGYAELPDEPPF